MKTDRAITLWLCTDVTWFSCFDSSVRSICLSILSVCIGTTDSFQQRKIASKTMDIWMVTTLVFRRLLFSHSIEIICSFTYAKHTTHEWGIPIGENRNFFLTKTAHKIHIKSDKITFLFEKISFKRIINFSPVFIFFVLFFVFLFSDN